MSYALPKCIRKYAFDKMIDLEIPESVAEFIGGRMPRRVRAGHYLVLARQASKFYLRCSENIKHLGQKLVTTDNLHIPCQST